MADMTVSSTDPSMAAMADRPALPEYVATIDSQLSSMYLNVDCVDNYSQYYHRFRRDGRQHYRCLRDDCHFVTNKSSIAVRHIRRHINEKPYKCWHKDDNEDCNQQFYQKCDLRVHLMRHFEDKPFKCSQNSCDKCFTTQKALTLHLRRHSLTEGLFVCRQTADCDKQFVVQWQLNKHIKESHKHIQPIVHKPMPTTAAIATDLTTLWRPSAVKRKLSSTTQLKSKLSSDLGSKLANYGFEEVIKYVITSCKPTQSQDSIPESFVGTDESKPSDDVKSEESEQLFTLDMVCCQSKQLNNQLFAKCIETLEAFIEIKSIQSIDSNHQFVYKWFDSDFTSDTIDGIVEHISQQISKELIQNLKNKYQKH